MTVRSSLENRLSAWLAAQPSPKPRIAWENVTLNPAPTITEVILRPYRMPAARRGLSLCSIEEAGIYQISIMYPKPGGAIPPGVGPAEAIAESLCAHFKPGQYAGFFVSQPPYYSQGIPTDDGRWLVPVSIFYRAEP